MNSAPKIDRASYLAIPVLAVLALPLMSFSTWITLTVAGAAMGMMLFLMASGLTLIFGLMDVMTFAHGAFITAGAYIAVSVLGAEAGLVTIDSLALNLLALLGAAAAAALTTGAAGWAFERVIIRRVYGSHLRQVLRQIRHVQPDKRRLRMPRDHPVARLQQLPLRRKILAVK